MLVAIAAGVAGALSGQLSTVGVFLIGAAGSLLGWAVTHLVTAQSGRGYAAVAAVLSMVAGVAIIPLTRAPDDQSATGRFIDPDKVVVVDKPDPNRPFVVQAPAPKVQAGSYPDVEIYPQLIYNRGRREVFTLTGRGFSSFSYVDVSMTMPDGTTARGDGAPAAENGTFTLKMEWFPVADHGLKGNNGGWPITITDRYTGRRTVIQLDIRSDAETPDVRTWNLIKASPDPLAPRFEVRAGTLGHMCIGGPAVSEIGLRGATPGGPVEIYVLDPDGRSVAQVGSTADAVGEIERITPFFWDTHNCGSRIDFEYSVVAVDGDTGRQAKTTIVFPTYDVLAPHQ
jgi:hypothetical protein